MLGGDWFLLTLPILCMLAFGAKKRMLLRVVAGTLSIS